MSTPSLKDLRTKPSEANPDELHALKDMATGGVTAEQMLRRKQACARFGISYGQAEIMEDLTEMTQGFYKTMNKRVETQQNRFNAQIQKCETTLGTIKLLIAQLTTLLSSDAEVICGDLTEIITELENQSNIEISSETTFSPTLFDIALNREWVRGKLRQMLSTSREKKHSKEFQNRATSLIEQLETLITRYNEEASALYKEYTELQTIVRTANENRGIQTEAFVAVFGRGGFLLDPMTSTSLMKRRFSSYSHSRFPAHLPPGLPTIDKSQITPESLEEAFSRIYTNSR